MRQQNSNKPPMFSGSEDTTPYGRWCLFEIVLILYSSKFQDMVDRLSASRPFNPFIPRIFS